MLNIHNWHTWKQVKINSLLAAKKVPIAEHAHMSEKRKSAARFFDQKFIICSKRTSFR